MKTIVITGASSGLGYYLAEHYAEDNQVINISRRNCDVEGVTNIVCDLANAHEIEKAFVDIKQQHDTIDLLINNAGHSDGKSLEESSFDAIQRSYDVNTVGPIIVTKCAYPLLKNSDNPHVVMINSMGGLKTKINRVSYSGSKWGLTGATKVLTEELKPEGILVTGLYPAALEQEMKTGNIREGSIQYERIKQIIDVVASNDSIGHITSVEIE